MGYFINIIIAVLLLSIPAHAIETDGPPGARVLVSNSVLSGDSQYPVSVDIDAVYQVNLWAETSNMGDFSGTVNDLFNNLHSVITNTTATNPKEILIHFDRTVVSNAIGLGAYSGNFSNVEIQIGNSGEIFTTVIDESAVDTDYTTRTFQLPVTAGFNAVKLRFHTADTITLSNCVILKSLGVVARLQAVKPDNTVTDINATTDGNLKITDAEDPIDIAAGNVTGYSTVHKFGRGADIDTADGMVDLWDGAEYNTNLKTYTFSTTADIDRISSDNTSDTEDIEIQGLDTNWDLITQTITLTGQTPASLTTSLIRIFRMKNVGSSDLVGNIFCFVNVATTAGVPDTIANVRAMIHDGNNQTLMAIYAVPNGKTAYIVSWYGALSSAKASSFNNLEMKARPFGGVFQLKHTSTLSATGSSHVQHAYFVPQVFPAKTDFIMKSDSSVNDNAVSAGFDLILIDD